MKDQVPIAQIVLELGRHNLLPAIVFRTARSQCDVDAERAYANKRLHLPATAQREIHRKVQEIVQLYEIDLELITSHPQYQSLITTGIGAHHAGQLLVWRLLLEELMAAGMLRVLVATGTVAAGVDFPARSVVITAHSRRGAEGYRNLSASEFQQMSGRAGRRGRDTVGFCIAAPSRFCDAGAVLEISKRPPEPLQSAYFPSPSTVLNLLRYRNVDGLRYTVEKSLAAFLDRKQAKAVRASAEEMKNALAPKLRQLLERQLREQNLLSQPFSQADDINDDAEDEEGFASGAPLNREDKRLLKRIRRMIREGNFLEQRQPLMLENALRGLQSLGYLQSHNAGTSTENIATGLSEKGNWSANLYTNIVLELSEIIEAGIFSEPSVEHLVAVVASICADPHRAYLRTKTNPLGKELTEKIRKILEHINSFGMPGRSEPTSIVPAAAHTALVWLECDDWHQFRSLLILDGAAEGDAARLITQAAENLNQISRLADTHRQLAFRAEEAKRRLLRPPLTETLNLDGI